MSPRTWQAPRGRPCAPRWRPTRDAMVSSSAAPPGSSRPPTPDDAPAPTAGAAVGPRAWRSRGPSDHAYTQLVGHSWHTRSVVLFAADGVSERLPDRVGQHERA